MAWSTPPTFVTGNVLTAAQMNSYVRDNTTFLFDPPACFVFNSTAISIASGTTVAAIGSFDSEAYDTDGMHSGSASTLTFNTAGVYICVVAAVWASNAAGAIRRLGIFRNGGEQFTQSVQNGNAVTTEIVCTLVRRFTVTDTIQMCGAQNSGGALNLTGQGVFTGPALSAHWIGNGV